MKKLIIKVGVLLIPVLLHAQVAPIKNSNKNAELDVVHAHMVHLPSVNQKTTTFNTFAKTTTTNVNAIDYLISNVTASEAKDYLYDFNQVGNTDIFSDANVLSAVQYFRDTAIDLLDNTMSNEIPFKFIYYFRAYEYHKYYQSSIDFAPNYVDALFEALPFLYDKDEYWSADEQVAYFRWFAAMTMDIDGHRGQMYPYIKLHMNTNSDSFLSAGNLQEGGMNAVTGILWRGLNNNDTSLFTAISNDTAFINDFMQVINNTYLKNNFEYVVVNYIGLIHYLLDKHSQNIGLTFDIDNFETQLLAYEASTTFGTNIHMKFITQMYKSNDYVDGDWLHWRQTYFDWEFPDVNSYDNSEIMFYTNMSDERRNGLFLAVKEAKANYFKLMGDTDPIANDTNDVINLYIYQSYDHYQNLSELLMGIGAIGGGVYIEDQGALYTYDREDESLPIEHLVKHEYIHYLDARHNIHGTFGEFDFYDWDTGRYSFWSEGLADFIAASPRNMDYYISRYNAGRIWDDNTYNSSSVMNLYQSTHNPVSNGSRTYAYSNAAWSYLYKHKHEDLLKLIKAVRENRTNDFQSKLDSITNISEYNIQYQAHLDSITVNYANTFNEENQNGGPANIYEFNPPRPSYEYAYNDTIAVNTIKDVIDNSDIISSNYQISQAYIDPSFVQIEIDTTFNNMSQSEVMKLTTTLINQKITEFQTLKDVYSGFDFVTGWMSSITETNNNVTLKITYELPQFGEYSANTLSNSDYAIDDIEITAYPNPFTDSFNIRGIKSNSQIFLYDLNGRMVYKKDAKNSETLKINIGNITRGMYILLIRDQHTSKSIKLIKR